MTTERTSPVVIDIHPIEKTRRSQIRQGRVSDTNYVPAPRYTYERDPINWVALCLVSLSIAGSICGILVCLTYAITSTIAVVAGAPLFMVIVVAGVLVGKWLRK